MTTKNIPFVCYITCLILASGACITSMFFGVWALVPLILGLLIWAIGFGFNLGEYLKK
ncbi:MAG: hypothetical protein PHU23_18335 [Dehalococcoidales bacterium]|nr:hypothetical protein [Dehalococcoidales bacterium]